MKNRLSGAVSIILLLFTLTAYSTYPADTSPAPAAPSLVAGSSYAFSSGAALAMSAVQYQKNQAAGFCSLTSGVTKLGAAYNLTGFTQANWTALAQRIAAVNGNSEVFAIGTLAALGSIIPAQAGLQYGLGKEIVDKGYLDRYYGTRLVVLDQALKFNTINTTAEFAIPDDMIYFLPVYGDKPIKLVYEGDNILVEREPTQTPDKTFRLRIQERVGVAAVIGSKIGALDLQ